MSDQLELIRTLPQHVEAVLDPVYRTVEVIDGAYHKFGGNVGAPDRNGRYQVTAARMRCGLERANGFDWARRGIAPEEAHQSADPCPKCFPQGRSTS